LAWLADNPFYAKRLAPEAESRQNGWDGPPHACTALKRRC
jgi:hypothetical protein